MTRKTFGRALAGAALSLALAAPAGAGTLYAWRTDDGGYAFADDLRRVPQRYRDRVEVRQSGDLVQHPRYTPQDEAATEAYARDLALHLQALRQRSQAWEDADEPAAPARADGQVTVRMGSDGRPVVDIPQSGSAGSKPVVIEDILAKPERGVQTRVNTVIRRGDEIIAIVRPENDTQRPSYRDEADLDAGEY